METIGVQDFGTRAAELLDRLAHGESFEVAVDGHAIGTLLPTQAGAVQAAVPPPRTGRTFNDWLLNGPRLDDLELPDRSRSPMRGIEL